MYLWKWKTPEVNIFLGEHFFTIYVFLQILNDIIYHGIVAGLYCTVDFVVVVIYIWVHLFIVIFLL